MSSKKVLLMTICCLLFVSIAVAEDISPPSWRGLQKSTVQEWDFMSAEPFDPYLPDGTSIITNNPYADPYCLISADSYLPDTGPGPGGAWEAWEGGGLEFWVIVDPNELPDIISIRTQITYYVPDGALAYWAFDHVEFIQEQVIPVPGHPDWAVIVTDWRQDTYPFIMLGTMNGTVSEVVIDSIPEPATLLLLGLGVVIMRRREK